MLKTEVVNQIIQNKKNLVNTSASGFAPVNIALCKYWGKRDTELNLPLTDSFSIALPNYGTKTTLSVIDAEQDEIYLNAKQVSNTTSFAERLINYLNLFREPGSALRIITTNDAPVSAGLASSASGFAALVKALNELYAWQLSATQLSILARLGSGSACRSLWDGFVTWQRGEAADGMDSYAIPQPQTWPELRVGLLVFSAAEKPISSRQAMQQTMQTSFLYKDWPEQVAYTMQELQQALPAKDFNKFGDALENNALAMHATAIAARPGIMYHQPKTIEYMHKIWQLRRDGVQVYFTQDAGPNLKLLFLDDSQEIVLRHFPEMKVIQPFPKPFQ